MYQQVAAEQTEPSPIFFHRWERDLGLENLYHSLQKTRPSNTNVKIICIMRLPKADVARLSLSWSLSVDGRGDARTGFRRIAPGIDVSLELAGY